MTAVALLHREEIIERVATGAYLVDIAAQFGIQPPAISKHLAADPEYQAAREIALEVRLEQREAELETAPGTAPEISRASALVRQAQWRCEREAPHRWGQKQAQVIVNIGGLGRDSLTDLSRVIEGVSGQAVADIPNIALLPSNSHIPDTDVGS